MGKLDAVLSRTPFGIKDAFAEDISKAITWRQYANQEMSGEFGVLSKFDREQNMINALINGSLMTPNTSKSDKELREYLERLDSIIEKGRDLLNKLLLNFTEKADSVQKALASRLVAVETVYAENTDLLASWFDQDSLKELDLSQREIAYAIADSHIKEADSMLGKIELTLANMVMEAQALEQKHCKRLYVLKALRQVCCELGFQESRLAYENTESKQGNIIYELDTIDQGRLTFTISLDNIRSFSAIDDNRCMDEYRLISDNMQKEYGVKARFRMEEENPEKELRTRRELELPGSISLSKVV